MLLEGGLIVGVARKGKGAVGQREQIAPMGRTVSVCHPLGHDHFDHRLAGSDTGQFHTQLLRCVIRGPECLGAGFGQLLICHVLCHDQRPEKLGARFSRNAMTPSL